LAEEDLAAALVLADNLEEAGDDRAADVRGLVETGFVIPYLPPDLDDEALFRRVTVMDGVMACGPWWQVIRQFDVAWHGGRYVPHRRGPVYVNFRANTCPPQGRGHMHRALIGAVVPVGEHTQEGLRRAFDECRVRAIARLFYYATEEAAEAEAEHKEEVAERRRSRKEWLSQLTEER
jgi:hypothetical protein